MRCVGVLYADIDKDSRAKRAFKIFSEIFETSVFVCSRSENTTMPYAVNNLTIRRGGWGGGLFTVKVLLGLFKIKPQIVFAEGLLPLVACGIYSALSNCKLIYDGREIYLQDEKGYSSYGPIHRFVEKIFIQFADLVVQANLERAEFVSKYYNLKKSPLIIRNIPQVSAVKHELNGEFSYLNSNKKFIVYQGHLGHLRDLDKFLKSLVYLAENIEIVIIGSGKGIQKIHEISKSLDVSNRVHVHQFVPHDTLMGILGHCDLGIVTYQMNGLNNLFCAPNKLYEFAHVKLPMITSPQLVFRRIFEEYPIGSHIDEKSWENSDTKKIAESIERILASEIDDSAFDKFNSVNSWVIEKNKYRIALEEIKRSL